MVALIFLQRQSPVCRGYARHSKFMVMIRYLLANETYRDRIIVNVISAGASRMRVHTRVRATKKSINRPQQKDPPHRAA